VNQRADAGDNEQHGSAQLIEDEAEGHDEEAGELDPIECGRGIFFAQEDETSPGETEEDSRARDKTAKAA
jgi:hypothetical protein